MQLNSQQLELQEGILKRLYPGVSMEEAKKKELGFGCIVKHSDGEYGKQISKVKFVRKDRDGNRVTTEDVLSNYIEVIGLPPTLPRILTALGNKYYYQEGKILNINDYYGLAPTAFNIEICDRQLLNEDMTDCNLREQSQETQDILYSIFCK